MTIDDLKRESAFQQLSDGQKKFVIARCEGLSNSEAAQISWNCGTDKSAIAQANKASKQPNVRWLLDIFFNTGAARRTFTREDFLGKLRERIEKSDIADADFHRLMTLYADVSGFRTKAAEPPAQERKEDGDEEFNL